MLTQGEQNKAGELRAPIENGIVHNDLADVEGRKDSDLDLQLLREFLQGYVAQPATAVFRAIELPALISLGIPQGIGIDIGCGDGKLTEILMKRVGGRELVGVDADPAETVQAGRRNLYATIHTTDAGCIPEPDDRFDFAISNSVLEHIPDLDQVLAEVARVLRRDGIFCLTVPHAGFRTQLAGPIMPGVSRADYELRLDQRLAHLHYLSAAEWRVMLEQHGFTIEIANFYLDRIQIQRWESISRWTAGVLDAISGGRVRPIAMQRSLGLRQLQNRVALPQPCAAALARILTLGLPRLPTELTEGTSTCVAIRCRKC